MREHAYAYYHDDNCDYYDDAPVTELAPSPDTADAAAAAVTAVATAGYTGAAHVTSGVNMWHEAQAAARAQPFLPHFVSRKGGGLMNPSVLHEGYDLLANTLGLFEAWWVNYIVLVFAAGGMGVGLLFWLFHSSQPVDPFQTTTPYFWPHYTIITLFSTGFCWGLSKYYRAMQRYNAAWGDLIALEYHGREGEVTAVLRTRVHRLCFVGENDPSYYVGSGGQGDIRKAKILLRATRQNCPQGLFNITMADLFTLEPGRGAATGTSAKALDTMINELEACAKAEKTGVGSWLRKNPGTAGLYIIAGIMLLLIFFKAADVQQQLPDATQNVRDAISVPTEYIAPVPTGGN